MESASTRDTLQPERRADRVGIRALSFWCQLAQAREGLARTPVTNAAPISARVTFRRVDDAPDDIGRFSAGTELHQSSVLLAPPASADGCLVGGLLPAYRAGARGRPNPSSLLRWTAFRSEP